MIADPKYGIRHQLAIDCGAEMQELIERHHPGLRISFDCFLAIVRAFDAEIERAKPCAPGRSGFEMGSSSPGPGGKPSDISNMGAG